MSLTIPILNSWPADTVPLPSIVYSGGPRNATITSPVEQSVIKRRSRFHKAYDTLRVTWLLDTAQLVAFQSFYNDDLRVGIACFSMELKYPKNSALDTWLVRFHAGHSTTYIDGIWKVEAELEILNPSTVNAKADRMES